MSNGNGFRRVYNGGYSNSVQKKAKLHSENDESRPPRLEKMWYQVVFSNQEGEKTPQ